MSAGSSAGCSQFRMNAMSNGWQPQYGPLIGLPIIPCPRCGDRVLELQMGDGDVFFKCRQNDQDVPVALRKCKFYKLLNEYERVLVTRGYGHLIGVTMTHPQNVQQAVPRYVEQTMPMPRYVEQTMPMPRYVEQIHPRHVEQNCNPNLQEIPKMEDTNLSAKMNKLIKLGELILYSLMALVVLVSLGLVVIVGK